MNSNEAEFRADFIKGITRWRGYARALVANCLMSGLPDLLIVSKFGYTFCAECKVWRNKGKPTCGEDLVAQLRGAQINVITQQFWPRGAYCPIISFDMDQKTIHHFDGTNFGSETNEFFHHHYATMKG